MHRLSLRTCRMMATWRGAAITATEFQTPEGERFALAELSCLHIVEQPAEASSAAVPWLRAGSVLVAAVAVVVAVRAWHVIRDYGIIVGVLLVTSLTSLIARDCLRVPEPVWELRATYRGRCVCLLRTTSEKAMCRVSVALLRAFGSRSRHTG